MSPVVQARDRRQGRILAHKQLWRPWLLERAPVAAGSPMGVCTAGGLVMRFCLGACRGSWVVKCTCADWQRPVTAQSQTQAHT